jgi:hypothetical protein
LQEQKLSDEYEEDCAMWSRAATEAEEEELERL